MSARFLFMMFMLFKYGDGDSCIQANQLSAACGKLNVYAEVIEKKVNFTIKIKKVVKGRYKFNIGGLGLECDGGQGGPPTNLPYFVCMALNEVFQAPASFFVTEGAVSILDSLSASVEKRDEAIKFTKANGRYYMHLEFNFPKNTSYITITSPVGQTFMTEIPTPAAESNGKIIGWLVFIWKHMFRSVGGFVALIILVSCICIICKRYRRENKSDNESEEDDKSLTSASVSISTKSEVKRSPALTKGERPEDEESRRRTVSQKQKKPIIGQKNAVTDR